MRVLFVDNHVLVVEKPAGLPVVPDSSGDESLLERARAWVKQEYGKPGNVFLGVVHRLDRPVSGVVVFARTSKGASRLSQAFRSRAVEKLYWGVGAGAPPGSEGVLEQWLWKDEARNVVRVLAGERPGALQARTRWRVLQRRAEDGPRCLLELRPETGRPHQLRVAAASLGCPLLGDLKYGARAPLPDKSIALHAHALAFPHPTKPTGLRFECDAPATDVWRW